MRNNYFPSLYIQYMSTENIYKFTSVQTFATFKSWSPPIYFSAEMKATFLPFPPSHGHSDRIPPLAEHSVSHSSTEWRELLLAERRCHALSNWLKWFVHAPAMRGGHAKHRLEAVFRPLSLACSWYGLFFFFLGKGFLSAPLPPLMTNFLCSISKGQRGSLFEDG